MPIHRLFFYSFILFLPTQLGRHFWPEWSHVWGLRVDYLAPTVYLSDILLLLTLSAWLLTPIPNLKFSYTKRYHDRDVKSYSKVASIGIILGVILFFNFQKAAFGELWFCKFVKLVELVLLAFYVTKTTKTKADFAKIVNLLVIGAIFESGLAIAQFIKQSSIGGIFWWLGERTFNITTPGIAKISLRNPLTYSQSLWLRPYGTFSHPNSLAGYLLVILALAFKQIRNSNIEILNKSKIKMTKIQNREKGFEHLNFENSNLFRALDCLLRKIPSECGFRILALAIMLVALLLACSRSVWLVGFLLLALGNLGNLSNNLGKRKNILFLVLLLLSFIFYLLSFIYTSTDPVGFQKRWQLTLASWEMFKSSPLFGIGLGHFIPRLTELPQKGQVFWLQPAHNIFLLVAAETGLVGLAGFLGVLGTTYKKLLNGYMVTWLKRKQKKPFSHLAIQPLILSLTAILLTGMFDHYWLTLQQNQLLFALILGLCWTRTKTLTKAKK